jgi:hypothetical protein
MMCGGRIGPLCGVMRSGQVGRLVDAARAEG